MTWFFIDDICSQNFTITGDDAIHIEKSLRMKVGEKITLCDPYKTQYLCEIFNIRPKEVDVKILEKKPCNNEPNIKVTLFQALPKGDKFDHVIQKTVELGACQIVPVMTSRCVSRPNEKAMEKKLVRLQKIAKQAAQQSRRGIIPIISPLQSLKNAAKMSNEYDCQILFYEGGGKPLSSILPTNCKSVCIFIGPEGGFSEEEVALLCENGCTTATLGKRILRTETAPLAAISAIMYATGNFD